MDTTKTEDKNEQKYLAIAATVGGADAVTATEEGIQMDAEAAEAVNAALVSAAAQAKELGELKVQHQAAQTANTQLTTERDDWKAKAEAAEAKLGKAANNGSKTALDEEEANDGGENKYICDVTRAAMKLHASNKKKSN